MGSLKIEHVEVGSSKIKCSVIEEVSFEDISKYVQGYCKSNSLIPVKVIWDMYSK